MDAYEATKVVYGRIQAMEPEHAAKIMGLLLGQDHGDKEMIRLAFGPESHLASLVAKARAELAGTAAQSGTLRPQQLPSSARLIPSASSWNPPNLLNVGGSCIVADDGDDMAPYFNDEAQSPLFLGEEYSPMWGGGVGGHRRSLSVSDDVVGSLESGLGCKPCMYYARGYCKNGSGCRFVHGFTEDAMAAAVAAEQQLLHSVAAAATAKGSPRSSSAQLMANAFPFSPSAKGISFLLQQQNETQRVAAAAAAMLLGDEHKYVGRSPRMDRSDLAAALLNPGARQIYLTFPADSTFSEEDVSNYFSIYGPVQDVRIPYQQKRMFGFVTFVYPETVKLILAKGNPHFVCDARVLVKPYKEKGKVPEKFRSKPMFPERGEYSSCSSPTGLLDSRDPFELPQLGPRFLYGGAGQESLVRKKLEEEELQQAIELEGRRFMGLQLDLNARGHHLGNTTAARMRDAAFTTATAAGAAAAAEPMQGNGSSLHTATLVKAGERESPNEAAPPNLDYDFQESGIMEHIFPDSPFASPTKASSAGASPSVEQSLRRSHAGGGGAGDNHLLASNLVAPSSLEATPYSSCFFQIPRISADQGAIRM